jgi:hypothetical protein
VRLEPQRLLAHGPSTLPADVVVDCGAVLRAVAGDAASPVWAQLADVSRASGRSFLWVVAPTPTVDPNVNVASLGALAQALAGLGCTSILRSHEPLVGLLRAAPVALRDLVVVTAEVEDHVHELVVLGMDGVTAALDVATGRLWDRVAVEHDYGVEPAALPELEAIAGREPGRRPVVRVAHVGRHRAAVAEAISKGSLPEQAHVPTSIGKGISSAGPNIAQRVEMLLGGSTPDVAARRALEAELARPAPSPAVSPITSAPFRPSTAYVLADVDVGADPLRFREAAVILDGHPRRAKGHTDVVALLREAHRAEPLRWFVPRALDVLGCLVDAGGALPEAAADPAHALLLLDPDAPPTLQSACPSARTFDEELSSWFEGADRSAPFPAGVWTRLDALSAIDAELQDTMKRASVLNVFESDIAATVPVLAHIERQGAWVEPPQTYLTWQAFEADTHEEIEHHERIFLPLMGAADPYASSLQGPVEALHQHVRLTREEAAVCRQRKPVEYLERLGESGFAPAVALRKARRLTQMLTQWVRPLSSGIGRARAHMGLERTGRWATSDYNLQGLTKSGPEGHLLRSAMRPPPRCDLVVADYSAFEARILAGLTQDPEVLAVKHLHDFHTVLAGRAVSASGPLSKRQWKDALYGMSYGQGRNGFVRAHPEMAVDVAGDTFDAVAKLLAVTMAYRQGFKKKFFPRTTPSVTPGGWRRRSPKWTSGFNTLIQGQAADIFRYVLRRLHAQLKPLGAFLVHQAHDEVFVACPAGSAPAVALLVQRVMEQDVAQTQLGPRGVPLFAQVSVRKTWAEGT